METTVEKLSKAFELWANDTRGIEEMRSGFLAGGVEKGLDINSLETFLSIFLPDVISARKERIIRYYNIVWASGRCRRARAKMKAAAMCGFFEREAAL